MKTHSNQLALFIILLVSLGVAPKLHSQQRPTFQWARTMIPSATNGTTTNEANAIANYIVDNSTVVCGKFNNSVTLGSFTLTSVGGTDIFVARYNQSGTVMWARSFGTSGDDEAKDIACSTNGKVFITGTNKASGLNFGCGVLAFGGVTDAFVASLDVANGNCLWSQRIGGAVGATEEGTAITVDAFNRVFVAGYCNGTAFFGSHLFLPAGSTNPWFLCRLNAVNGTNMWVTRMDLGTQGRINAISDDNSGTVYVGGEVAGTPIFRNATGNGTTTAVTYGSMDGFLAKYSQTGSCGWARLVGGVFGDFILDVEATNSGANGIYIGGSFQNTATFGSFVIPTTGQTDGFVARFNTLGVCQWVNPATGASLERIVSIGTDSQNGIYCIGHSFSPFSSFAVGGASLGLNNPIAHTLWAKLDFNNAGTCKWNTISTTNFNSFEISKAMAVGRHGNAYFCGRYGGLTNFGDITLPGSSILDQPLFVGMVNDQTITVNPANCINPGSQICGNVTATGTYNAGNLFQIELSTSAGTFPGTIMGTVNATQSTTFCVNIPLNTTPGLYKVRSVATNGVIRSNSATIAVITNTLPVTASPPGAVCEGIPVTLSVANMVNPVWSPSTGLNTTTGSTVIATPVTTTTYTVTGTNIFGCPVSGTYTLVIHPAAVISLFTTNNANACNPNGGTTITASGANTYSWSPATGLNTTTGAVVIATPSVATIYTVTATNSNGCTTTASILIQPTAPVIDNDFCIAREFNEVGGNNHAYDIITLINGNNVTAGDFTGQVSFGIPGIVSNGGSDGYVVGMNTNGIAQWTARVGGLGNEAVLGVAETVGGDILLSGYAEDLVNFQFNGNPSVNVNMGTGRHAFIARLNPVSGNWVWINYSIESGPQFEASSIASDLNGRVYATGSYAGTLTWTGGSPTITSAGVADAFAAQFSAVAGQCTWEYTIGGGSYDFGKDVTVDGNNDVIFGGNFENYFNIPASLISTTVNANGPRDVYVIKMNSIGVVQWAQALGGANSEELTSITSDNNGDVFLTGTYLTSTVMGITLNASGAEDFFLVGMFSNGNVNWARSMEGGGFNKGCDARIGQNGELFFVGTYDQPFTIGQESFAPCGGLDNSYVVKLSPLFGTIQWAEQAVSGYYTWAGGVTSDPFGNAYLCGSFGGTTTFGTTVLNTISVESWWAKLCDTGNNKLEPETNAHQPQGVNEMMSGEIALYPNPTDGSAFFVELKNFDANEIRIVSLNGAVLFRTPVTNPLVEVQPQSGLPVGMYILEAVGREEVKRVRFVVQ
jgi:hypothetical protein